MDDGAHYRRLLIDSIRDYVAQLAEEGLEGVPNPPGAAPIAAVPNPMAGVAGGLSGNGDAASVASAVISTAIATPLNFEAAPGLRIVAPMELLSPYPGLEKSADLAGLRVFIGDCQRCKLAPLRKNLVFGVGNPKAELMFVGEAPGADEDAQGEPFVGRAGQLLTDIIERGMGLKRADVYICNVIKCRPPENRNPEPDEVAACEPFLMRQIDLVRPRAIVGLGTFAVQALLKVKTPISRLRGIWQEVRGVQMMPTFHPAYLLRNPSEKRRVWEDIQQVMKLLGITPATRGGRSP